MEFKEIVAITGMPGLFQLLSTKSDGAIVKDITDESVKFISARKYNITPLDSIEVYTIGENVKLAEVMHSIYTHEAAGTAPVNVKTATKAQLIAYFKVVFPTIDEDRVYQSDMKKMVKWYQMLSEKGILKFEEADAPAEAAPATIAETATDTPAETQAPVAEATPDAPAETPAPIAEAEPATTEETTA